MILFGGGIDSCALVELYRPYDPILVYFDYGQKAYSGEVAATIHYATKYNLRSHVIKVPPTILPSSPLTDGAMASDHAQNYLPGRNLVFAALALPLAIKLGCTEILLGASPSNDNVYNDAKQPFADMFNALAGFGYPGAPALRMPLLKMKRIDYARFALSREPRLFDIAFSCYESKTVDECGLCTHCKIKAALKNEVMLMEAEDAR